MLLAATLLLVAALDADPLLLGAFGALVVLDTLVDAEDDAFDASSDALGVDELVVAAFDVAFPWLGASPPEGGDGEADPQATVASRMTTPARAHLMQGSVPLLGVAVDGDGRGDARQSCMRTVI
ncbi:MAG: hypothetical protein FWD17_19545 [Polyangiaceae bacterium]|nr:hypothetical protein [Polyangiaceae bacterium]